MTREGDEMMGRMRAIEKAWRLFSPTVLLTAVSWVRLTVLCNIDSLIIAFSKSGMAGS